MRRKLASGPHGPEGQNTPFKRSALHVALYATPASTSRLGKQRPHPIDYRTHAGGAAQIAVDDDPIFRRRFWESAGVGRSRAHADKMPAVAWPRATPAQSSRDRRTELQHQTPHRLIGDVEPAFGRQLLDIAVAQGEAGIQPDRVLDDLGWEAMATVHTIDWACAWRARRNVTEGGSPKRLR